MLAHALAQLRARVLTYEYRKVLYPDHGLLCAVVPMFQPEPALTFFERFLAGEPQ